MSHDNNPLCLPLLQILHGADAPLSEYDLIKALGEAAFPRHGEEDSQLKLFRQHFFLMNALYQLQASLQKENLYLYISALEIYIRPMETGEGTELSDYLLDEKLSAYYLDWANYDGTTSRDVSKLLEGFWKQYRQYHQRLPSLQLLGLDENASWSQIQQSYRRLVNAHHPDKGGDKLRFMEIREAYEVLQSVYDE